MEDIESLSKESYDDFKETNFEEDNEDLYKDFSNTREFHVLDEIDTTANDDEESKSNRDSDSSSDDGAYTDEDDDIPADEIDAMLEEGIEGKLFNDLNCSSLRIYFAF